MGFGRLLALVIGLAAVAFAAKYALVGTLRGNPEGESQPKRQLDQVRSKAKELERMQQKAADDVAARATQDR
jgi:hypothetical protein